MAGKWQEKQQLRFISSCLLHIGRHAGTASITESLVPARAQAAGEAWSHDPTLRGTRDATPDTSIVEGRGASPWMPTRAWDNSSPHTWISGEGSGTPEFRRGEEHPNLFPQHPPCIIEEGISLALGHVSEVNGLTFLGGVDLN